MVSSVLPCHELSVRDITGPDFDKVFNIEQLSYPTPWTAQQLKSVLKRKRCFGVLAVCDAEVAAFLIVEVLTETICILNLAVHPDLRRRGIGRKLLGWLVDRLAISKRKRIVCEVRDSNLAFQLFLRRCGFLAIEVLRDYYQDPVEDAYQFERLAEPAGAK